MTTISERHLSDELSNPLHKYSSTLHISDDSQVKSVNYLSFELCFSNCVKTAIYLDREGRLSLPKHLTSISIFLPSSSNMDHKYFVTIIIKEKPHTNIQECEILSIPKMTRLRINIYYYVENKIFFLCLIV
jgi:hypothetical protein